MNIEKNDKVGGLKISEEVIAKIATVAAKDVDGVADMAPATLSIKSAMSGDKLLGGVKVSYAPDKSIIVDVYIRLKADAKLRDVVADVQQNVRCSIMNMTNRPVAKVNVTVSDIEISLSANR